MQSELDINHIGSTIMMTTAGSNLSRRGAFYASPENNNALLDILRDAWDPVSNPNGFLSLGVAENVRSALLRNRINEICEKTYKPSRHSCTRNS